MYLGKEEIKISFCLYNYVSFKINTSSDFHDVIPVWMWAGQQELELHHRHVSL